MALSEPQIEALALAAYERLRQMATISPPQAPWASLEEAQKEEWRVPIRSADAGPATVSVDAPARKVYLQQTRPTAAVAPALWIPLNGSGDPLAIDQWQVFV